MIHQSNVVSENTAGALLSDIATEVSGNGSATGRVYGNAGSSGGEGSGNEPKRSVFRGSLSIHAKYG